MKMWKKALVFIPGAILAASFSTAYADGGSNRNACRGLPSHAELTKALADHVATSNPATTNGGLDNNMWATVVNADGIVCAVTRTGLELKDQWLGRRLLFY